MERKTTFECADDEQPYLQDDAETSGAGRVADEPFTPLISCGGHYGFARTENRAGRCADLGGACGPANHTALRSLGAKSDAESGGAD